MRLRHVTLLAVALFARPCFVAAVGGNGAQPTLPGARPVIEAIHYRSIQAAIDALSDNGGIVRLPPGVFEISDPLVVGKADVTIEGAGTATHIKNVNTDGKSALILQHQGRADNRSAELWRIRLANLRITGNMIEECQGTAIVLDRDCYGIALSANVIAHENAGGIDLRDAHGCAVSANVFTIVKKNALVIGPDSGRITVTGNSFSNSYIGQGLLKRGTNDRQAAGMVLGGAGDVTVVGNLFSGLGTAPLAVPGKRGTRILFSNNIMTDVARGAKTLKDSLDDSVVKNNLDPTD